MRGSGTHAATAVALLALLACASAISSSYQWRVDVADPANPSASIATVVPGSDYLLVVRLADDAGSPDSLATLELSALGLKPRFFYQYEDCIDGTSLNTTWESTYRPPSEEWRVPFRTGIPGIAQVTVYGNHVGALGITVPDVIVSFAVSPFQSRSGPGQYSSLIGAESTSFTGAAGAAYRLPVAVLQPSLVPGVSPLGLAVFDASAPTLLASSTEFRASAFLALDLSRFAAEPAACPDLPAAAVPAALALADRVLLSTRYGLVQAAAPSAAGPAASLSWSVALRECVAVLSNPTQYNAFRTSFNDHQFALTAPPNAKVFVSMPGETGFTELSGWSAGLDPSVARPLALTASLAEPNTFLLLLDAGAGALASGGRYAVRVYNATGRTWGTAVEFPAAIPNAYSTGEYVAHVPLASPASGGVPLTLAGLQFSRAVSLDLFATGSALLYSASGGRSFVTLRIFSPRRVAQLETSSGGYYALLLDDQQAWYGEVGEGTPVQLGPPRADPAAASFRTARALFFDLASHLFELSLAVDAAGALSVQRADPYSATLGEVLMLEALGRGESCPVSSVAVIASHDSNYTRTTDDEPFGMPPSLFIDKGGSYALAVALNASEAFWRQKLAGGGHLLSEPTLLLQVGRTDLLAASVSELPRDGSPLYRFVATIQDKGADPDMAPPGERLEVTPIRFLVAGATAACRGASDGRYETVVHTGCPPGRRLVFDETASGSASLCSPKFNLPCFKFSDDFIPVFNISDAVDNTSSVYTGRYFLEVTASGELPSSLRAYTAKEVIDYNYGKALAFVAVDDVGTVTEGGTDKSVYSAATAGIQWVCAPGNPCERVFPKGGEPPELYMQLRVSTMPETSSYCNYTTLFVIRLTGISMDATTTYLSVGVTIAALVAAVLVSALVHRIRHPEFFGYEARAGAPRPHEE